jgi:hypothetical protein
VVAKPIGSEGRPLVTILEPISSQCGTFTEPIVVIAQLRSLVAVAEPFAEDGVAKPLAEDGVVEPFAEDGVAEPIVPLEECRSLVAVAEPIASVVVASCGPVNGSAGRNLVSGGMWHLVVGRTLGRI